MNEQTKAWHLKGIQLAQNNKDARMYVVTLDGKKISMPRYYKDRIYHPDQRKAIAFHTLSGIINRKEQLIQEYGEGYNRDMAAAHIQAFKNMESDYDNSRKKL